MARPERDARLAKRAKNLALLRRRIAANRATIDTISAKAKGSRTATERRNLAAAREENAVFELVLDLGGWIDTADQTPDVEE